MYCSYHPSNAAKVRCSNCERGLCPYCDHRIKGYTYCQECIVAGIDALAHISSRPRGSKRRAWKAALCSLFPGGGAVYNRQNIKALIYFITTVGLFQLSTLGAFSGLIKMVAMAFYFYSMIDSYRTAELIAAGESPAQNEERFKRALARRAPALGLLLISGGLLFLLQLIRPFGLNVSLLRFLPAGLIVLGGYLIVAHLKRKRDAESTIDSDPTRSGLSWLPSRRGGDPVFSERRAGRG